MAYSMDFRRAVARPYDGCGSSAEVAEELGCSESWVRRLIQRRREGGTLEPRPSARRDDQRAYDDADEPKIRELIRSRPDATLAEVAQALGKPASQAAVSRTLKRLGLPPKKKSTLASERGRRDVRAAWFARFSEVRLDQLVFVDEFGASTQMQRTHGRAPAGELIVAAVPHGNWEVVSTVAAMTARGVLCLASYDAATDPPLFTAFVREALVPLLAPGHVVVLDNVAPHKSREVRRLVESAGATLLLPPYSPDLNPIEMAIAKVKAVLRKLARRTVDALFEAIGDALASVADHDARNYIATAHAATI